MSVQSFHGGKVVLHQGDCLDVVRTLPDNSIDSVCTDPPYHLASIVKRFATGAAVKVNPDSSLSAAYERSSRGFMGRTWDGGDIAFRPETWAEVLRVLKPGGHLVAFAAAKNSHRMVCAIEDAGFEIREGIINMVSSDTRMNSFMASLNEEQLGALSAALDNTDSLGQLAWTFGQGFPKSLDVSKQIDKAAGAEREITGPNPTYRKDQVDAPSFTLQRNPNLTAPATAAARQWEGWGTALKPAWEPICLARKPLSESTISANVLRWGTGAINVDGCRVEGRERTEYGLKTATRSQGVAYGSPSASADFDSSKGRFPANLCISWPEDEYELRPDITKSQLHELSEWFRENA